VRTGSFAGAGIAIGKKISTGTEDPLPTLPRLGGGWHRRRQPERPGGGQGNRILTGEDLDKEIVIPAGNLAFSADAVLARLGAQQVQGDLAQQHKVLDGMVETYAA
jgi:hypothetical protein